MMVSPAGGSDEILATLAGLLEDALYNPGRNTRLVWAGGGPNQESSMARKAHVSLDYALDLYLIHLGIEKKTEATLRKYRWLLNKFCAMFEHRSPAEVTYDDCLRFLGRWTTSSPSTMGLHISILRGFFDYLRAQKIVAVSPMKGINRPRRHNPEDLEIVWVESDQVDRMFAAVDTWQELICLGVLSYAGVRRKAAADVRRRDVDLEQATVKFREKGGKVIVKPIAHQLVSILEAADDAAVWATPKDWLIPNFENTRGRKASLEQRSNRIVYDTVKRIGKRCGVNVHPHALRAAFAVQFDKAHPRDTIALKELLGHSRIETTLIYLRRKDKRTAMDLVRDLSWGGSVFPADRVIPPAGFEPALPAKPHQHRVRAVTDTVQVPASLQAKLDQLSAAAKRHSRV